MLTKYIYSKINLIHHLINWHLRKVVFNTVYQKKKFINEISRSEGHVQKRYPTQIVVSSDHLSPTASNSSAKTAPENTDEDPNNHEPADE